MISNLIHRYFYSFLLNHRTRIEFSKIPTYSFSAGELRLVTLSTNNMISTPAGYFRFCRSWRNRTLYNEESKKIFKMLNSGGGQISDNQCNRFMLHEYNRYKQMNPFIKYDSYSSNRSIASYKVACMLGLDTLLTQCEFCWLRIDGSEPLLGTMSSIASGIGYGDLKGDIKNMMTPSLLRDLSNLEIADTICFESDHGANNYMNMVGEDGKIEHLCAFDNDNPRDFYCSTNISNVLTTETKSLITKDGYYNRRFADKHTIDSLLAISKQNVSKQLNPYLNLLQIYFCWERIKLLQKAVKKSLSENSLILLDQKDWMLEMVSDEVAGKNGRTYMYVLVDWRNYYSKLRASKSHEA